MAYVRGDYITAAGVNSYNKTYELKSEGSDHWGHYTSEFASHWCYPSPKSIHIRGYHTDYIGFLNLSAAAYFYIYLYQWTRSSSSWRQFGSGAYIESRNTLGQEGSTTKTANLQINGPLKWKVSNAINRGSHTNLIYPAQANIVTGLKLILNDFNDVNNYSIGEGLSTTQLNSYRLGAETFWRNI